MKHKINPLSIITFIFCFPLFAQQSTPTFVYVDMLEKVLPDRVYFVDTPAQLDVCRGEQANFQFVVRHTETLDSCAVRVLWDNPKLTEKLSVKTGFVGFVRVGRSIPTPGYDQLFSASGYYPDPIREVSFINVKPGLPQPIIVSVKVPEDMAPGKYTGTVVLSGKSAGKAVEQRHSFSLTVYAVNVPQTLWVTNWFDCNQRHIRLLQGGDSVQSFTPVYWEYLRLFAKQMKEYRQNVVLINTLDLVSFTQQGSRYKFNFSRFDSVVTVFQQEQTLGKIESGHIARRESTWETPFVVAVPVLSGGKKEYLWKPVTEPEVKQFYSQYIPALLQHLKEKKLNDKFLQHLADEPIPSNANSYAAIAKFIKSLAPELLIIEACHSKDVDEQVDVWVPQLDFYHKDYDFYRWQQTFKNKEVWFYTCLAPQGNYANRFIQQPLLKTRLVHWINYRFGATGYLHWGLNAWGNNPFDETSGVIPEAGNYMPAGDAYIIYPGNKKIESSLRNEAMRDGIIDYELLKLAEKKHPEKVKEIARQLVYRFDWYDMSVAGFREKRKMLLQLLTQQ